MGIEEVLWSYGSSEGRRCLLLVQRIEIVIVAVVSEYLKYLEAMIYESVFFNDKVLNLPSSIFSISMIMGCSLEN